MTDYYVWFDPFQARDDAEYYADKAAYERYDLERYLEGYKGENRAMKAHIEHLMKILTSLAPPMFSQQPVIVPAGSIKVAGHSQ